MAKVSIKLPHTQYDIVVEPGVLAKIGAHVKELAPHGSCALLGDSAVMKLYGAAVESSLKDAGYDVVSASFEAGEAQKNLETVKSLYDVLLDKKLERKTPVIALGGGVAGDMVGFVASTYLRGVPFIQCPTSLLAMVDASVGGKVGVNVPQGKNLVGSFYQPQAVIIDPQVLKSLSEREFRCGMAECVKHGVLGDAVLFQWIEDNVDKILSLDEGALSELIERNVKVKADVVMQDEKESGVRALLNLGHTFAHAIEATSGYGVILHGEAVSLGLVAAASMSAELGRCDSAVLPRVKGLLEKIGLPTEADLAPTNKLIEAMRLDKKVQDASIRFVLPNKIGEAEVVKGVEDSEISKAWEMIRK